MQRTSIYAQSHKIIGQKTCNQMCQNCQIYQQEIKKMRRKMIQKFQQIDNVKPTIIQMLEAQDMMKYQDQLIKLRQSYQRIMKKLNQLDEENQYLLENNQKIISQNKKLKNQLSNLKYTFQKTKTKQQEQANQRSKQNTKLSTFYGTKSTLSQLSANTNDKTIIGRKQYENYNYYEQILERRLKIQDLRHKKIGRLEQLLADV